jgi:hypothetical protein
MVPIIHQRRRGDAGSAGREPAECRAGKHQHVGLRLCAQVPRAAAQQDIPERGAAFLGDRWRAGTARSAMASTRSSGTSTRR